ncbi:HlyD family secretion protein [Sedimentitalea nanhaiensis]|uniref:Multidrug resistance efflux pump n=1 Tax=Sedimentitalea nanhaiensis TaxID=999627 RepID=A0A1I7E6M4_9RHOB|nr:biotin/lipoyl-binding protein [Sedimentitalea nanhaiensis]SFU19572.1 Multidrug resistance efflux pump [Sedimentitalea nanhaiensis]
MLGVVAITLAYLTFIWIVFVRFKWMRFTPTWGLISAFFLLHLLIVPLVGTRMQSPYSTDVRVVRHTIQLVPRLPEPTMVTEVRVKENMPVKKGDILFVFDQSIYKSQVRAAQAAVVAAKQNAKILEADIAVAKDSVARAQSELDFAKVQQERFTTLASQRAGSQESADEWTSRVNSSEASLAEAQESQKRAELAYASQIDGVNTAVIQAEAELAQAQYYLDQTQMKAPNDGVIVNLQVQEGMVSGILRVGAIATLILDQDPYLIAAYRQENLMNVRPGQPVVVAINTYPGKHFTGKVDEIWYASRRGQYTPSGNLPLFPDIPLHTEARLPVKITLDDPSIQLGIGVGGATLILTSDNPFTWLGQISLRTYTWARWVYPLPI